uniref:Uncharacterized protein n=1 Tax=Oryza rufipogon TaxID=4529 RepID=A0A0E0R5Y8_ORYRU
MGRRRVRAAGSAIYMGFTKFTREEYVKLKAEGRIMSDGVNAQLLGSHGRLAKRAPGKAFLAETIQASA